MSGTDGERKVYGVAEFNRRLAAYVGRVKDVWVDGEVSDLKRNPAAVRWVALLVLVMRVVDITWTIGPVFRSEGSSLHWLDFAVVFAMGAAWLALFWRNLAGRSLVPAHDPYFKEAVAHGGH